MEERIFEEDDSRHGTDDESLVMPSFNRVRDNYLKRIENELKTTSSSSSQIPSTISPPTSATTGALTPWNNLLLLVFFSLLS
jgi:hypothetical protein